jgi:hypothetical protein
VVVVGFVQPDAEVVAPPLLVEAAIVRQHPFADLVNVILDP